MDSVQIWTSFHQSVLGQKYVIKHNLGQFSALNHDHNFVSS